jgi:hypothetical protein
VLRQYNDRAAVGVPVSESDNDPFTRRLTHDGPATRKPRALHYRSMPESWESLFVRAAAFDVDAEAVTEALAEVRDD